MLKFKNRSIQFKMTSIILWVTLISLILSSFAFVGNDLWILYQSTYRNIKVKTSITAINLISTMAFNDQLEMGIALSALRADPRTLWAYVFNTKNELLIRYHYRTIKQQQQYKQLKQEIYRLLATQAAQFEWAEHELLNAFLASQDVFYLSHEMDEALRKALNTGLQALNQQQKQAIISVLNSYDQFTPATLKTGLDLPQNHLVHSEPIVKGDEVLGRVLVVMSLRDIYERLYDYGLMVAIIIVFMVLLVFFLSLRLQRIITEPILNLAKISRAVSEQQDYALRAQRLYNDEVGLLVDDFNHMLSAIQSRDKQLAQQRDELEQIVTLRTAELRKANTQLTYQAYHDALTNLPNRALFVKEVSDYIEYAQQNQQQMAMLFLDLDRFKYINDSLGHSAGDRILQETGKRLLASTRQPEDMVARLGGDEFTILLRHIKDPSNAGVVASKIITALAKPFRYNSHDLYVTPSIGISIYPKDGTDVGTLMRNADTSMYTAKQQGRNNYQYFTTESNNMSAHRLHMENRLRQAIEKDEFEVWYQPRFALQTQTMVSAEALIRWRSPEFNVISPAQFIPLAEDTGLIMPIGEWVLRRACHDCQQWRQQNPDIKVSVNLSARQFADEDLINKVANIIQETALPADALELELTESLIMPKAEDTIDSLHALKNLGVQLSVDDFGTGYSSLSYLKRFPIDILKIDQSFIHDIGNGSDDMTLVSAIIAMAHKLNLQVVAEGVEQPLQLDFLRMHECDFAQGYLFSKPLPVALFQSLLQQHLSLADFSCQAEQLLKKQG